MGKEYLEEKELLCVQLGGLCYGIHVEHVAEILQNPAVSAMPWLPEYYLGVCNWNGEILPVAELKRLTVGGAGAGTGRWADGQVAGPGSGRCADGPGAGPGIRRCADGQVAGDGEAARNRVVIVIRDEQYVCGLQTEEPPFILRVSGEDRLEGEALDPVSSECHVEAMYRADGRVAAVIDVRETLREMAVCE